MNRRALLTLTGGLIGGAYVTGLAETLGSAPEPCHMRTGTVVELLGASQVVVDIGGGQQVNMPALTQYDPILGDVVQILQQGSIQFVLGRTAPLSGDNVLANPSFELDAPGSAPSFWTVVTTGASATIKTDTASGWGSVTGTRWLEVNQQSAGISTAYVISEAIPVRPGERWTAAGWAMNSSLDFNGGSLEILLTWYTSATAMYPSTAAADVQVQAFTFPPGGTPGWFLLRQVSGSGVTVPDGITYMRVVLTSYLSNNLGASAYWDGIICRMLRGV